MSEVIDKMLAQINADIAQHSGHQKTRDYLSMSTISLCPRKQYVQFADGFDAGDSHPLFYLGYLFERDALSRLARAGVIRAVNLEIVAPFDELLKGHIDAETTAGDLLEIKSVTMYKFGKVVESNRAERTHFEQVHIYMHYGGYKRALVLYIARETFAHHFVEVPYFENVAQRLEDKAKRILDAIRQGRAPECECGHCE